MQINDFSRFNVLHTYDKYTLDWTKLRNKNRTANGYYHINNRNTQKKKQNIDETTTKSLTTKYIKIIRRTNEKLRENNNKISAEKEKKDRTNSK